MAYQLLEQQADALAALEVGNHIIFSRNTRGRVADDVREGTVVGFEAPGQKDEKVLVKLDGKYPMPLFVCAKGEMRLFEEVHPNVVPSMEEAEERFGFFVRSHENKARYYVMLHLPQKVSGPLFMGDDPVGGYALMMDDQSVPYGKVFFAVWPSIQSFDSGDSPAQLFDMEQQAVEEVSPNSLPSMEEVKGQFGLFLHLDMEKTAETESPVVVVYMLLHRPQRVSGQLFKGDRPVGVYALLVDDQDIPYGKVMLAVWPNIQSFNNGIHPTQLFDMEKILDNANGRR